MRTNPYTRLKEDFTSFVRKVFHPYTVRMWTYPQSKLCDAQWNLFDLCERVRAGDQLGYDVRLKADKDGLHVDYVRRVTTGDLPWDVRP